MTDSAQAGIQAANRMASDAPERTEFTANVTAVREVARINGRQLWQLALSYTLFSHERCRGILTATARSGRILEVEVVAVEQGKDGEVWHTTHKPLQDGTEICGRVDAPSHV